MDDPKQILDYATPPTPKSQKTLLAEELAEKKRLEAVEKYNLATFGTRSPTRQAILDVIITIAIGMLLIWLFPGRRNPIPLIGACIYLFGIKWFRNNY